jgi:hypothetical protein
MTTYLERMNSARKSGNGQTKSDVLDELRKLRSMLKRPHEHPNIDQKCLFSKQYPITFHRNQVASDTTRQHAFQPYQRPLVDY